VKLEIGKERKRQIYFDQGYRIFEKTNVFRLECVLVN